jgi:membrane-bound lytic murein transglycosylase A|tara:strand:+ start:419 stop:1666 length:1248 start_codon:yes stop_codon:yes gene_type:complete
LIKKILSLILLFFLVGCGQLGVQNSCDCDLEKNAIAELEAKIIELKKRQDKSTNVPKKSFSEYGLLRKTKWEEIEAKLQNDQASQAWPAWIYGCEKLIKLNNWRSTCEAANNLLAPTNKEVIKYLHAHFDLYKANNEDGSKKGLITGYYQPSLKGSRTQSKKYKIPLYAPPLDLITVDLSKVYPELKYKRLRGRVEGKKLIPYFTREEIAKENYPLQGNELLWVQNPVEAFFLEIQGSGVIEFEDGSTTQVGYADQNGHPYRSMGLALIRQGELKRHRVSMQSIKYWAKKNKRKLRRFLNANPSTVFFRELPQGLPGPIGALGVPISSERSVAVDRRFIPLGAPIFLSTTEPNSNISLDKFMIAQDTGGAINGGVRADFYWGQGKSAGAKAGKMKQSGEIWVMLPKNFSFPATPK